MKLRWSSVTTLHTRYIYNGIKTLGEVDGHRRREETINLTYTYREHPLKRQIRGRSIFSRII